MDGSHRMRWFHHCCSNSCGSIDGTLTCSTDLSRCYSERIVFTCVRNAVPEKLAGKVKQRELAKEEQVQSKLNCLVLSLVQRYLSPVGTRSHTRTNISICQERVVQPSCICDTAEHCNSCTPCFSLSLCEYSFNSVTGMGSQFIFDTRYNKGRYFCSKLFLV